MDPPDPAPLPPPLLPDPAPMPLPSLRLLVPPLQLLTAAMWRALRGLEVHHYWKVAQFVSLVMDAAPQLLLQHHWTQLGAGLRAKYILELCRAEEPVELELLTALLDKVTRPCPPSARQLEENFVELVQTMLKDPEVKQHFFSEVYPVAYGPDYDQDLLTLFEELLHRLAQLLPTPDLKQVVLWLGSGTSLLEECEVSSTHLRGLLNHHRQLGHLEQHVPPSSMGDRILSSLAEVVMAMDPDPPPAHRLAEVVMVTDYTEVVVEAEKAGPLEEDPAPEVEQEQEVEAETARPHGCCTAAPPLDHTHAEEEEEEEEVVVVVAGPALQECSSELPMTRHLKTHAEEEEEQEEQQAVSVVPVRSSGRRRRPTMKVQIINLQKRLGRGGAIVGAEPKKRKQGGATVPFNTSEHSHGSSEALLGSAADAAEGGSSQVLCSVDGDRVLQAPPPGTGCHGDDAPAVLLQDGRFGCPDCAKSFRFRSLLASHRRIHTGEQPFLCAQCGRRFSFKQSLERHRHTHRGPAHPGGGAFLCLRCGRSFTAKSALVRHAKTHGEEMRAGIPGPSPPGEAELHKCDCGKSFSYRAALTAHRRVHRAERPHACAQCGKRFLYRGALLSHLQSHSPDTPFACSFCAKRFKRERSAKKHERCHTRQDVYCCSQCDRSFVYKATLTRHELTHSGQRPFLCAACGKGFFSHAELLKHERFHTGHAPFQCPFCGKRFTQSCYLTVHLRYHTGARPYACTACDKSFLSANRLKRHQRTHTGEKPYLCTECGRSFRQSYHLKVHLRTHAYA